MEIRKIEKSDLVLFPRLQRPGLKAKHVAFESFKAELKHIEGHGDFWLLYQQDKPHLVVHVQLPKSEAEFELVLACVEQEEEAKPTPKKMIFDKPFFVMLRRTDATNPYFCLYVANPELLVRE